MTTSPYAPPKADLVNTSPVIPNTPVRAMSELTNEELREILCNPEIYISEAVHNAAIELSSRKAIPRYSTYIYSQRLRTHFAVHRENPIDLFFKIRILFSESNLKRYSLIIAIIQSMVLFIQVFANVRLLKLATSETIKKDYFYIFTSTLGLFSSAFLVLFFFTLYKTLCIRTPHSE